MHWTAAAIPPPTEQEIRDCFAPLYDTDSATDTTTEPGAVQYVSQMLRVTMKDRVMMMEITVPTAEHQKMMTIPIRTTSAE